MEPLYNPELLDKFKTSINYAKLRDALPERSPIFIDWHDGFEDLTVKGKKWTRMKEPDPAIVGHHHAMLTNNYANNDAYISVTAHVFSPGSEKDPFDYMLRWMASTSSIDIHLSPVPSGPGDSYFLAPQIGAPESDATGYILLSNIVLIIDTAHTEIDVRDFAEAFVQTIDRKENKAETASKFSATPEPSNVAVGEAFSITYRAKDLNRVTTTLDRATVNERFEAIVKAEDHIKLKAVTPGDYQIRLRYMDRQTLYSDTVDVPVSVEP